MAFKNGLSERLDELRFPSPRSPSDTPFPAYSALVSPGGHSNFINPLSRPPTDVRSNLQRRFTTDSSKLSSWNYLNQNSPQLPELDMVSSVRLFAPPPSPCFHMTRLIVYPVRCPGLFRLAN